mgnify:CR=1 FL=1
MSRVVVVVVAQVGTVQESARAALGGIRAVPGERRKSAEVQAVPGEREALRKSAAERVAAAGSAHEPHPAPALQVAEPSRPRLRTLPMPSGDRLTR